MRSKLGYTIKRKKLSMNELAEKWLCNSCSVNTNCSIDENGWECEEGACEGVCRSIYDKKYVVKCSGYQEQLFNIKESVKDKIGELADLYAWKVLEGERNITQQSDGFLAMIYEIYFGLMYVLQHRKELNRIILLGKRSLIE